MDTDKASVAALTKVIKEKDRQIEELSEQIKIYADDLDNNAAIIEDLRAEIQRSKLHRFIHSPLSRSHFDII